MSLRVLLCVRNMQHRDDMGRAGTGKTFTFSERSVGGLVVSGPWGGGGGEEEV